MEDPTRLGHNRTGMQMSPLHGELLLDTARQPPGAQALAEEQPESTLLAELRREYVNEAEALGSMPPPATLKGMAKAGAGAITGQRLHAFIDKVGERLAYERGGARLYDAALVKIIALSEGTPVNLERAKQIRDQEVEHAAMLAEALTTLGADPTAQTPCADVVGMQAMGLMQSITEPRTSLAQTLSSLLAAELIDVASWELLARLARSVKQEELAERFERALQQENQHLQTVTGWYEALVMQESKLLS